MRAGCLLPLLVLGACKPDEELIPLVTVIDAVAPERVELAPAVGQGEVEVPVRLLNRYGAAVEGDEVSVSVSGVTATSDDDTVTIDPSGYGELDVVTTAPEVFTVEIVGAGDASMAIGEAVDCWSVADTLGAWGLRPSWILPSELGEAVWAASLLEGVVLANDMEVWFLGIEPNALPHRVLTMPDPILEIDVVHVDNDGLPDLMVRSEDEVVLLRGRSGGGMSWGAGFAAEGLQLLGSSMDDVNGDTRNDVGFALQGSEGTFLVVMAGDGAWGFEELEEVRFELDYTIVDLELSQSDTDGEAEVAFLESNSVLMRYYWSDDGIWAETFPSSLETHLAEPAVFLGAADMDAGGADDPAMLSHAEDGVEQSVVFYTLDSDTTQYQKSFLAPAWALDDITGDGNADIMALEGGDLHVIHFVVGDGNPDFAYHTVGSMQLFTGTDVDDGPVAGPIAAGLLDGDRLPDLAVYSDGLHLFPGTEVESGWASTDADWTRFDLQLQVDPTFADLDEEAGLDTMAGWINAYAVPTLRTWWMQQDEDSGELILERRGEILFEDNDIPYAVSIHDGLVYGLWDDEGSQLVQLGLDEADTFDERGRVSVEGTQLVTGAFADGAVVAVLTDEGVVTWLDAELATVGNDDVGSFGCVAAGDTDGDGVDELLTASADGCQLLPVDLDADGAEEVATIDDAGLTVAWGDETHNLEGGGYLGAHDLDGDGMPEVLAARGGQLWMHRALSNGFAPGTGLHGATLIQGPLTIDDTNGDGLDDLLAPGEDGTLLLVLGM